MLRNEENLLAIIIPAYKKAFFKEALNSIACQTNKHSTVYIGDDSSPEDLYSIVKDYENTLNIVYHRFDKNLGGTDLVGHWNRCIDLSRNEPWIWLFSDDDLMDQGCVASLYEVATIGNEEELFHFNVNIINEHGIVTGKFQPFPQRLSSADFFANRITYRLSSYVVEYVFHRAVYLREGKFKNFDLAWCSDDATWIKFGKQKGIYTITGPSVLWRYSQINISSKVEDRPTIMRKLASNEAYIRWVKQFLKQNYIEDKTSDFEKLKWMLQQFIETSVLSYNEKLQIVDDLVTRLEFDHIRVKAKLYITYMEVKKRLKG